MNSTRLASVVLGAWMLWGLVGSVARAAHMPMTPAGAPVATGLSVLYDPLSGQVAAYAPSGIRFTALELLSKSGSFTGDCQGLTDVFDVCTDEKTFKLDVRGFADIDFGPILPLGWDLNQLTADLTVNGATLPRGFETGSGVYAAMVPEPSTAVLLSFAAVGTLCGVGRRRHQMLRRL